MLIIVLESNLFLETKYLCVFFQSKFFELRSNLDYNRQHFFSEIDSFPGRHLCQSLSAHIPFEPTPHGCVHTEKSSCFALSNQSAKRLGGGNIVPWRRRRRLKDHHAPTISGRGAFFIFYSQNLFFLNILKLSTKKF